MRRSTAAVLAASAVLGAGIPARAQVAEVRAAIEAKFPGGKRRCLTLAGNNLGIHVERPTPGTLYYPSTGPTSPNRHLFVFHAARADAPVPDLVSDLVQRGVLRRTVVDATVDAETQKPGPDEKGADGRLLGHTTIIRHERSVFPVAIYETAPASPDFAYEALFPGPFGQPTFPGRLYGDPLPPADRHYPVPTTGPYVVSMVTAACVRERIESVSDIRPYMAPFGLAAGLQAEVTFSADPPDWMLTPAFIRAAYGPRTAPVGKPRTAAVLLQRDGGRLTYVQEQ